MVSEIHHISPNSVVSSLTNTLKFSPLFIQSVVYYGQLIYFSLLTEPFRLLTKFSLDLFSLSLQTSLYFI